MGEVYEAFDTRLHRVVAIKRLLPDLARDAQAVKRFLVEARAVAALNHPNVVHVHDILEDAHGKYIVMEFVAGRSLADRLQRTGALAPDEALGLMKGIARALASAHHQGVIHRDIKPANILLAPEGVPKLADFGLAQLATSRDLTLTGTAMGSWNYAAPEQMADAKRADARSDVFSCGATLYEMLTGEPPRHIHEEQIPKAMRPLLRTCLAKAPEARYQSAEEFQKALDALAGEENSPSAASAPGRSPVDLSTVLWRARRRPWSHPLLLALGAALVCCALVYPAVLEEKAIHAIDSGWNALVENMNNAESSAVEDGPLGTVHGYLEELAWARATLALGLLLVFVPAWRCLATEYRLLGERLVERRGLLSTWEQDYALAGVREVRLSRSLCGTLLGYSTLTLLRKGKMPIYLEGIPRGEEAKRLILSRSQGAKSPAGHEKD